ncbi:serine/threonine-protein kinase [Actinoallomurus sp. CA-150999]|uniref:serine/threonine-protein kinase n=1 Tax=Actinoallomurus sp. CA-150999 TaxID=3239887 RepID=UPI003D8BF62A
MTARNRESPFTPLRPGDPETIGGYRIAARLGAGGMGQVYLSHTPGGRAIALKVIRTEYADDPHFRHRFAREVESALRVQGPHLATVIDYRLDGPTPWLATAYVPGPSLAQLIDRHGRLPADAIPPLAAGVAEALQAIHRAGIVHRDLKPSNVLVTLDGPYVIDFGIARALEATPLTRTGGHVGTPAFMAPEQVTGAPATPATDVFALGLLTVFAATGHAPFGDGPGVLQQILNADPDLGDCPDPLRDLAARCLAKDPADRPGLDEVHATYRDLCQQASPLFADGWLPGPIASDLRGAAPPPPRPAPQPPTAPATPPAFGHVPTITPTHAPTVPTQRRPQWRGPVIAVSTLAAVLVAAAVTSAVLLHRNHTGAGTSGNGSAAARTPGSTAPAASAGRQLLRQRGIDLPLWKGINFSDRPLRPVDMTGADLAYQPVVGLLPSVYYDAALLSPAQPRTYETCRGDTRYIANAGLAGISPSGLPAGSAFCLTHHDNGLIVLVRVARRSASDSPSTYMTLDITIWQGPTGGN